MCKIFITGVSGVGKSTLGLELIKRGVPCFDLDEVQDLCHWRNKKSGERAKYTTGIGKDWLEAHEYICDKEKLEKILSKQKDDVAVLGLALNQENFLSLFDKIFLLHCKEEVFLHRLNTREGNQFAKDKSDQEWLLSWYKGFEANALKQGAIAVNAGRSTSEIADEIIKSFIH